MSGQLLLRRLLDQAGGPSESGYLLVLDGEGLENVPEQLTTLQGLYSVHRVSTELGLRQLLWKARGAPLIAVLPQELAQRIQGAPDLLRRARNQRVHALYVNDVLEVVLGVRVVGAETPYMQRLALENVEALGAKLSRKTLPTVIDRRLLTELLVDVSVGEHVRTRTPAQLLAAWLQDAPAWSDNVRRLVCDALPALHGDEGRLLAWALQGDAASATGAGAGSGGAKPGKKAPASAPGLEVDTAEKRLQHLLVHGAVLTVETEELPKAAFGELWRAAASPPIDMDRRVLRRTAAHLAEETLAALGDDARGPLGLADRIARTCLTPSALQTSRVLPLAFADRGHDLARRAADGKPVAASEIEWLASHRAALLHREELAVLDAMARVSRYLAQPPVGSSDVLEQVQAYLRDGSFADLAMQGLRRALAGSVGYHQEAQALLKRARERRDAENLRFATTLAGGYEAALHKEGLVPLHRLWKRVVEPMWKQEPKARLFLVVLDGCSYPLFLELLMALAQDSAFPVGMRADAEGHVVGMPGLAPLPTVTSHARGALFLGQLPQDPLVAETVFRDQDEAKTDKARLGQNPALAYRSARLFLKGDLSDSGHALIQALGDSGPDVVAAVFNAVDDQIGSANTGAQVRLNPEDINGFKPSLRAALKAGRRVLITADHGHTPFVHKDMRAGSGKTPRYLGLGGKPVPEVPEGFLEIDLGGLGGPAERRAFAWQGGRYLGNPQVGFHGGCSLEEMVVPLAWIERDGLQAEEPTWWFGLGCVPQVRAETVMRPVPPPLAIPVPSDELVEKGRDAGRVEELSFLDPAVRAEALPLPKAILARLHADEKAVLALLMEAGDGESQRTGRAAEEESRAPQRAHAAVEAHAARGGGRALRGRGPAGRRDHVPLHAGNGGRQVDVDRHVAWDVHGKACGHVRGQGRRCRGHRERPAEWPRASARAGALCHGPRCVDGCRAAGAGPGGSGPGARPSGSAASMARARPLLRDTCARRPAAWGSRRRRCRSPSTTRPCIGWKRCTAASSSAWRRRPTAPTPSRPWWRDGCIAWETRSSA